MNLSEAIRAALIGETAITSRLATYAEAPAVFTRRPAPSEADYPLIMVSPDITITDEDGVNDQRPVIIRDIAVYGRNDTAARYRNVEVVGYAIRDLFHRQRHVIDAPDDWNVIDVRAQGPRPAPVDDDTTVGRLVELTVRLSRR